MKRLLVSLLAGGVSGYLLGLLTAPDPKSTEREYWNKNSQHFLDAVTHAMDDAILLSQGRLSMEKK